MVHSAQSSPLPQTIVRRMSEADFTVALHVLKQAVDATSSGIVISDPHLPDNPIIYHNPTFERLTGYAEREITGRNCRFLQGPDTNPTAVVLLREAIARRTDCQVTLLNYKKDGTPFWNELYMSPVLDPRTGRLTHFIGVQNDVTARMEAEQERDRLLAQQKRVADALQDVLLALPAPDTLPLFDFHVLYEPAWEEAQVGGDFFDIFALSGGGTAFVVGDVTGKGLAAAAYTGQLKFALRLFLRDDPNPARALSRLNQFMFTAQRLDNLSQYALASVSVVVADASGRRAAFATAGAEPPLLLRSASVISESHPPVFAAPEGPLIGVLDDADYQTWTTEWEPGDTLVLCTDGITEARPPRKVSDGKRSMEDEANFFGLERVSAAASTSAHLPLSDFSGAIYQAAQDHACGRLHDDVCVMSVRRRRRPA